MPFVKRQQPLMFVFDTFFNMEKCVRSKEGVNNMWITVRGYANVKAVMAFVVFTVTMHEGVSKIVIMTVAKLCSVAGIKFFRIDFRSS